MNEHLKQAITLMRDLSSELKKQAAVDQLKATGIDEDKVNVIASKFASQSDEAATLAADVLTEVLGSKTKSASFGKAVTDGVGTAADGESGNRFTDHDAEFMSLDF